MTVKEIEKILKADGWYFVASKGSHNQYKHTVKPGKVTVPNHKGDIPTNRNCESNSKAGRIEIKMLWRNIK